MVATDQSTLFLSVIQGHKGIIYKIANSYCRDPDDRNDLVQEMIIQLWKSFGKYDDQYKHSTWMYRICLNVAISFYRKEIRRKEISHPLTENILHLAQENAGDETEKQIGILHGFISELKELDRAIMLLYLDEKNYKEMADIMGISETNIATKINRIKTQLKHKFSTLNTLDYGR